MRSDRQSLTETAPSGPEKPCWQEFLEVMRETIYPTNQQLEAMLDYLERTP